MDYRLAFEILEISPTKYEDLTLKYLTKCYRKLALKHHPDKNSNTEESNERFKKINEAYHYLRFHFCISDDEEEQDESIYDSQTVYANVLNNFIKSVMDGNCIEVISKIVNDILMKGKNISLKIFEDLDKDIALNIYIFLSRYKSILYFSDDLLDNIKHLVIQKYNNVEIYKLNPSINDIMRNNFYKLYVDKQLYLVPLWHKESYYDGSGCEIIAICEPDLPKNIKIDDDNNLLVEIELTAYRDLPDIVINNENLTFYVGDIPFHIPICELYLKKEQHYRLKKKGLVNVKKDLYDFSDKSDIIVKIKFI